MKHARHMLWKWRLAPEINPIICQYKGSCKLWLHLSRDLNPFHPAYMHNKRCRKTEAKRQWHPPDPKISTCAWPLTGVDTKNSIHTLLSCVHCMPILYISIDFETFSSAFFTSIPFVLNSLGSSECVHLEVTTGPDYLARFATFKGCRPLPPTPASNLPFACLPALPAPNLPASSCSWLASCTALVTGPPRRAKTPWQCRTDRARGLQPILPKVAF